MGLHRDREWLRQKYWYEELSARQIARIAKVSLSTVLRNMVKLDISRRPTGNKPGMHLKSITVDRINGKRAHQAWEEYWGECVPRGQATHHIDGDRTNNKITNLTCMGRWEHISMHRRRYESNRRQEAC